MNKKLPEYLLRFDTNVKLLAFVTLFSFVFIYVYTPFEPSQWFNGNSSTRQFIYSAIAILAGVAILAAGRFFLSLIHRKKTISILQYGFWLFGEIVLIATSYTIFTVLILNDSRNFHEVYQRAIAFTSLILFIPYTVSYLYFALKDKDSKLQHLQEHHHLPHSQNNETTDNQNISNDIEIINFVDDKGSLKLSIRREYVLYLVSADNYVNIFYQNKGKVVHSMLRSTLKSMEEKLEPYGFIRCHRSYLVNIKKVKIVRKERDGFFIDLDLDGINDIPISKTYSEKILRIFSLN